MRKWWLLSFSSAKKSNSLGFRWPGMGKKRISGGLKDSFETRNLRNLGGFFSKLTLLTCDMGLTHDSSYNELHYTLESSSVMVACLDNKMNYGQP
jgi:hypothetical protein